MAESPIDAAIYDELAATAGADFVAELAGTFLEEAPLLLQELRQARAGAQAAAFSRAAHSLKSNAQTFGALALAALARALELAPAPASVDAAALQALEQEYTRVAAALQERRGG